MSTYFSPILFPLIKIYNSLIKYFLGVLQANFESILNIIFLISVSNCSTLIKRKVMFILYFVLHI